MYGSDQYIYQYETELGPPWKNQELWIKLSYPFFHADRITTPTLFLSSGVVAGRGAADAVDALVL